MSLRGWSGEAIVLVSVCFPRRAEIGVTSVAPCKKGGRTFGMCAGKVGNPDSYYFPRPCEIPHATPLIANKASPPGPPAPPPL